MPNPSDGILVPFIILLVLLNLTAYRIKKILEQNNYRVSYFSRDFGYVRNIFKLAKTSGNKAYWLIGYACIAFIVSLVGLVFFMLWSSPSLHEVACASLKEFKQSRYEVVVRNKYIDSTNHSYQTLVLEYENGGILKNTDFDRDHSGFFEQILIGDTLRKRVGDSFIRIVNAECDTAFVVTFGCGGQ